LFHEPVNIRKLGNGQKWKTKNHKKDKLPKSFPSFQFDHPQELHHKYFYQREGKKNQVESREICCNN